MTRVTAIESPAGKGALAPIPVDMTIIASLNLGVAKARTGPAWTAMVFVVTGSTDVHGSSFVRR
jgi:hypothetical protein